MTHELWSNLNKKMTDYLESVTLHDVVIAQKVKDQEPTFIKGTPVVSVNEIEKRQTLVDKRKRKM
jgi:Rrf2 family iron-sulfur cluster assembly transcriptional regulator